MPDFAHLLPEAIRPFTRSIVDAEHLSFMQGGGHGGSHPHLVNEFVSALVDDRDPWPNAPTSANWTCVGILAHESAVAGGEIRQLPEFTRKRINSTIQDLTQRRRGAEKSELIVASSRLACASA